MRDLVQQKRILMLVELQSTYSQYPPHAVTLTLVTHSSNLRRPPGFMFVIPGIELCSIRTRTTMKEDVRERALLKTSF